jgi:hypothetical protein
MDHDAALAALTAATAQCSDACVDEAVHAEHRAEVEQAYADFAAASKEFAANEQAQRRAAGIPPSTEPVGEVTITTNGEAQ